MADSQISHSLVEIEMFTIAKVFDIDEQTGFMASDPPLDRLPHCWEAWEIVLDVAIESKLQVGDKLGLTDEERAMSKRWRDRVRAVRTTPIISSTLTSGSIPAHSCLPYPLLACWALRSFFADPMWC